VRIHIDSWDIQEVLDRIHIDSLGHTGGAQVHGHIDSWGTQEVLRCVDMSTVGKHRRCLVVCTLTVWGHKGCSGAWTH